MRRIPKKVGVLFTVETVHGREVEFVTVSDPATGARIHRPIAVADRKRWAKEYAAFKKALSLKTGK